MVEDQEFNSGVEFPGQCLEPLMTSGLRINMLTINDHSRIVVEYRPTPNSEFSFKFNKTEKLVIGTCEYCNKKNIMRAICKCKVVKYCDE